MAPMSNPWTVAGKSALIAQADYDWERVRYPINEGPVVLQRAGRIFLIYSASDTGTPDYVLGMLTYMGGDVMNPKAWKKSPVPVFNRYSGADGSVSGPGHNGFFKSPDGREDWIIYHGKETSEYTYAGRTTRAQKFRWRSDGTPEFGRPIPGGVPLQAPSGEGKIGGKGRSTRRRQFYTQSAHGYRRLLIKGLSPTAIAHACVIFNSRYIFVRVITSTITEDGQYKERLRDHPENGSSCLKFEDGYVWLIKGKTPVFDQSDSRYTLVVQKATSNEAQYQHIADTSYVMRILHTFPQ